MTRMLAAIACAVAFFTPFLPGQSASSANDADVTFAVYFSRHGVRSPTGTPAQYNKFSAAAWPEWEVAPGYLTPHGFKLMELFGQYDRLQLLHQGLLTSNVCADAQHLTFYADSDQRTRETGNALAKGLFPGCSATVRALPEGTNDPLFHLPPAAVASADRAQAAAAIAGRLGGNARNITQAFRSEITALDTMLATCGNASDQGKRTSLLDIPVSLSAGQGDHLVELKGPINTASTLSENMLLEYTNGMADAQVGWGCIDGAKLRTLINLHTAATDYTQRTPTIATQQAAPLLDTITKSLAQAVEHKAVPGALGKPDDHALFLIGHDTNILNMAGALQLTWIADGRRDDTAPGSTLVFELSKSRTTKEYSITLYLAVQTLEQMRFATPLTMEAPPERVPVFIPGCSRADFSCSWPAFEQTIKNAVHGTR